jgi:hypothetical protein
MAAEFDTGGRQFGDLLPGKMVSLVIIPGGRLPYKIADQKNGRPKAISL